MLTKTIYSKGDIVWASDAGWVSWQHVNGEHVFILQRNTCCKCKIEEPTLRIMTEEGATIMKEILDTLATKTITPEDL